MELNKLNIQGFGELDTHILDSKEDYRLYHRFLPRILEDFRSNYSRVNDYFPLLPNEHRDVQDFVSRLIKTISVLQFKYIYNHKYSMKIDVTDSSFPSYEEIRLLGMDLEDDKKLPSDQMIRSVKEQMLNDMFQNGSVDQKFQQLLSQLTFQQLTKSTGAASFIGLSSFGSFECIEEHDEYATYIYSWMTYDSQVNRPQIYFLQFDYYLSGNRIDDDPEEVEKVLSIMEKIGWRVRSPLDALAVQLDESSELLRPKLIKRIDLGPYFGPWSKDTHDLTTFVQGLESDDAYIFAFTTETLFSAYEEETQQFLKTNIVRQIWDIPSKEKNIICNERKCSTFNQFLIAPHKTVQEMQLDEKAINIIGSLSMPPITII